MEPLENINIIRPYYQSLSVFKNTNTEIESQIINGQYPIEDIDQLTSLEKIALLYHLILLNKYDEFKNIIESYDIDLNDGDNILIMYCCHNSMHEYIILLLKNGVNINVCDDIIIKLVIWPKYNIYNNNKQFEFIKYLIDNGANIYCDNNYPLRISTTYGTYKIVDLLLDYGADFKVNNNYCLCSAVKKIIL
nr:ankyrin repeat domain containing protein [Mimivirus sp.]